MLGGKMVKVLTWETAIKKLADNKPSPMRTSELLDLGMKQHDIRRLVQEGVLERIKQGNYQLATDNQISEVAQIARLFPDGILCMYTALFYYGYSNRTPLQWDIAVDKNTSKSRFRLDYPYVQPYYLEPHLLEFGVTQAEYPDCTMKIFNRDRLVCECIKYESKMDRETYNKAIQAYVADPKKNVAKLLEYAEKRRLLKKVKDRIGVWL